VDNRTQVPRAYVQDGQIVLNISTDATQNLVIGNELIAFQARFGGVAQSIAVPVDNVSAIYARENGHGMAFEIGESPAMDGMPGEEDDSSVAELRSEAHPEAPTEPPRGAGRSHLKLVK